MQLSSFIDFSSARSHQVVPAALVENSDLSFKELQTKTIYFLPTELETRLSFKENKQSQLGPNK
jgi:hypothetical protein